MSKSRKTSTTGRVAAPKIRIEEEPTVTPTPVSTELTFGPDTYKWMGIGFGLVILGLLLMAGSRGDNFAEFDTTYIYSFVKITLAPIIILAGLGTVTFAILRK